MKIQEKLSVVFDKSQHGHQNQAKLADGLRTYYLKLKDEDKVVFRKEFIYYLKPCLVVFIREPAVERVVEFAARFAALFAQTSDEDFEGEDGYDSDNFYHYLFDFLLKNHNVQGKAVRMRVCQLVKLLLHVVPRDAALEEDLVERITDCMLARMYDVIPGVRAQAVRALTRLQQPTENNCPIIERYLFLLSCDESPEVRTAVLSCITLSTKTLPEVIKRVRDVKESVRKLAYQVLAQKVSIRALTCSRRLLLVEQGLLDQCPGVREIVKTDLLQAWLRTYQYNILEVLEKLDAVGSLKTTCKAVQAMFDFSKVDDLVSGFSILNKNNLISYENLTPESALYWSEICEYLRKKGIDYEEHLEKILPSLTEFCKYIELYFEKFIKMDEKADLQEAESEAEEKEFIAEQLLKIASGFDLSDDAGRRRLNETVRNLTSNVDVTHFSLIVSGLARILKSLHDSEHESERIEMAAEMIQDAREKSETETPTQATVTLSEDERRAKQIQLARIRVKVIEISEELDEKIADKDFSEASEIQKILNALKEQKLEIEKSTEPMNVGKYEDRAPELRNDPATILKCLQITKEVCSSISFFDVVKISDGKTKRRRKVLHPTLLELVNTLILPSIANPIPAIREVAVECLGNCCLYSFDLSAQHLPLFLQIIQADIVEVRIKALAGIVDILRIYGIEAFAPTKEKKDQDEDEVSTSEQCEEEEDENNYVTTMILSKIVEMLDEDNADIRYEAASGLAMILISGRIVSPAILSRLVLVWYNPTTQEEHNTLNKISCFLDAYPYMCRQLQVPSFHCSAHILNLVVASGLRSPEISDTLSGVRRICSHFHHSVIATKRLKELQVSQKPLKLIIDNNTRWNSSLAMFEDIEARIQGFDSQLMAISLLDPRATHNCIEEAFLPTLRTLFDAPNSSPLASVNIQNVAELLVHLTKPSNIRGLHGEKENDPAAANRKQSDWLGDRSAHDGLAVRLSNEVLRDPQSVNVSVLARTLSILELSPSLQDNLKDLTVLSEQMMENVKNKQALRYLKKFQTITSSLVQKPVNQSPDVQVEEDSTQIDEGSEEPSQEKTELILPDGLDESDTTLQIQRKRPKRSDKSHNSSGIRA